MRLFSAYLNRQAARDVNSVFEAQHDVEQISSEGKELFRLVKQEEQDETELEVAEKTSEINDIIREEKEQIQDIEGLVSYSFRIIREGVLLIHTQLDQLKKLIDEDKVLGESGFPIEVADQLEAMLHDETEKIVRHLREMGTKIEDEDDDSPS